MGAISYKTKSSSELSIFIIVSDFSVFSDDDWGFAFSGRAEVSHNFTLSFVIAPVADLV